MSEDTQARNRLNVMFVAKPLLIRQQGIIMRRFIQLKRIKYEKDLNKVDSHCQVLQMHTQEIKKV